MKDTIILGIGSRIMMDDGIGIYLVEDLKKLFSNPDLKYIIGETDIDYCLSEIADAKFVIIIDAYLSGKNPGKITVNPLFDLEKGNTAGYSLHGIHILNLLQGLKHELNGILIGIEPYEITYGFNLSDTLRSYYPVILNSVNRYVTEYLDQRKGYSEEPVMRSGLVHQNVPVTLPI